jgi:hypothetical protein
MSAPAAFPFHSFTDVEWVEAMLDNTQPRSPWGS